MKLGSKVLLLNALWLPGICAAQQLNYTYVELGYAETEFEVRGGGELDGDGFTLAGSVALTEEWHAFAAFGNSDLDFGIDLDSWMIGAGYRYPLRDDVDVYGRLAFVNLEADLPGPGDPDDDGLGLQVRIRGRLSEDFELEGGVQYIDVSDSDTSLQAEGRYFFTDDFSVGVGLTFGGDTDGIGVTARYSF